MSFTVLVIDDHDETRDIIAGILRSRGFTVQTAANGAEGLKLIASGEQHLIVVDGMMPDVNGWEFTARFRQNEAFAHVPIIMFSAADMADQKLEAFNAGVDDYMIKPIQPDEFLERVHILLAARYGEDAIAEEAEDPPASPQVSVQGALEAPKLIGVMGSRGGAGTTTVAINLAVALTRQNRRTILVDMDLRQGHVAKYLKIKTGKASALSKLGDLSNLSEMKSHLPALLASYQENLAVLTGGVDENGRLPTLTDAHTEVLLDILLAGDRCVVVDMGLGYEQSHGPILDRADDLLLCVRPERVALTAARQRLALLRASLFPSTRLHAILLDFYGSVRLPPASVSQFLGQAPALSVHTTPAEMATAVNHRQALVTAVPEAPSSQQFIQFAQQLVDSKTESAF